MKYIYAQTVRKTQVDYVTWGTRFLQQVCMGECVNPWTIAAHIGCCTEKGQRYLRAKHNLILNNKDG